MDLAPFRDHLPEIERRLEALQPDALVLGLGPSARLLKEIQHRIPKDVRLWGVNDVFDIMPVHDVVCMDPPWGPLSPEKNRGAALLKCTPERMWLYRKKCAEKWLKILPEETQKKVQVYDLKLLPPHKPCHNQLPDLEDQPYTHTVSSPCGTTCMAWQNGARKIGVIGVDLLPGKDRLYRLLPPVTWFFSHVSHQAWKLGGRIANLSPFSKVKFHKFPWKQETPDFGRLWTTMQPIPESMCGSAPIDSSISLEPRMPSRQVS